MSEQASGKQSPAQALITIYLLIGLGYALYQTFFTHSHHNFFYNLGAGLVWPLVMFPALGKIVGAILIFIVIVAIMMN